MTMNKPCWDPMDLSFLLLLAASFAVLVTPISCQLSRPMECTQATRSCLAYMYYPRSDGDTPASIAKLFQVDEETDIMEENSNVPTGGVLVSVNCTCSDKLQYFAGTAYKVTSRELTETNIVEGPYKLLGYVTGQNASVNQLIPISLLCGCTDSPPQPLLSYVVQNRDTTENLVTRFNASMSDFLRINNVTIADSIPTDVVLYIPIFGSSLKPVNRAPSPPGTETDTGGANIPLGAIVGIVLTGLLLVAAVAALVFFLQKRQMCCYAPRRKPRYNGGASTSSEMHRDMSGFLGCFRRPRNIHIRNPNANVKRHLSLSKEMMNSVFGMEKPIIFPYQEILAATDEFTDKNHLGAGAYGAVYRGKLRNQDVAIKRMKATKRKEFFAELKVLCKVHHTNLVELLGYSVSEEELFLVYEFAENRAVSDRLHDPLSKEYTPLTWNARVQIALDAARGLEYIHEHTKAHYVHRDVKTSNILLDGYFRAKIADFGLAKLVEQPDGEAATTGVVGTSGYLAPEYLRDGQATAKSDVYAFGVVLFELITGEEAFSKTKTRGSITPDKRSVISIMLNVLGDSSPCCTTKLKSCVDPLLQDMYPLDCVHKMATLGRQCVEEDPAVRPDMKQVVFTLSQLLLASIEWEATLAGNSQVFSGLVQGR